MAGLALVVGWLYGDVCKRSLALGEICEENTNDPLYTLTELGGCHPTVEKVKVTVIIKYFK